MMGDKPALNSIGSALYRYAYFMTQSQDLSKSMVFLVQDRARMMLSHTWHQMPLVWLVKMLREYCLHLQLDEGINAERGGDGYLTESDLKAPVNHLIENMRDEIIKLPLYLREPLVLQIVFGMSIRDIAWLLGAATLNIDKRLFDAKSIVFYKSVVTH
jgi:DNA-directed RNA polymerase specialized sigma24 family protein